VKVIGLDLSLTSTGVATVGHTDAGITYTTHTLRPPRGSDRGHRRLAWLLDQIVHEHSTAVDLIAIEGPSFGSPSSQQKGHHERAGLWWLVAHALWKRDVPVGVIPPAAVKKYATGKGNAGKDEVLSAVVRRFTEFDGGNDQADALVLASMAADHLGSPVVDMPATHRAALVKVEWPELILVGAA
jgi:crossover junction endodeoxyribonuclease RuvC